MISPEDRSALPVLLFVLAGFAAGMGLLLYIIATGL